MKDSTHKGQDSCPGLQGALRERSHVYAKGTTGSVARLYFVVKKKFFYFFIFYVFVYICVHVVFGGCTCLLCVCVHVYKP